MITERSLNSISDTYISSANPTVNYRSVDLSISTVSTTNKIACNFILPSTVDEYTFSSARISLYPKTLSGGNTNYSIKSALLAGSIDYRYITWNSSNNGVSWSIPGGDLLSDVTTSVATQHSTTSRLEVDCTVPILHAYKTSKILNVNLVLWTEESNVNTVYFSVETAGNGPILIITEKEPHTGDRMGRNTSIISVPSI